MRHINLTKIFILGGFIMLFSSSAYSQCVADYDFGDQALGIAPDPYQGETFEPAIVDEPYLDILHMLIPEFILDVDPTLPFSPTTTLDSVQLVSMVLVNLDDSLATYEPEELGLAITCYNNDDSGYPCTFLGGNQYCATITGTPNNPGHYRADIVVRGFVLVFGFPFGQEQLFGSMYIDIGIEGCMNESADNYDPEAVVDDGSCYGCYGDVDGDFSVTVSDVLTILAEFGCSSNCTNDLNGDGNTTVADLLVILSVFGNVC